VRYNIKGTLWVQRELEYGEDLELKAVLRVVSDKFASGNATLSDLIDTAFDGETLPALFAVILKPYEPTPAHRLYNAIVARWRGIDRTNIVRVMPNSQLAAVLADFFMLNTGWIGSLPDLQTISALTSPK